MGQSKYNMIYNDALQRRSVAQINKSDEVKLRVFRTLENDRKFTITKNSNFAKTILKRLLDAEKAK
jgi:hypothetical protein